MSLARTPAASETPSSIPPSASSARPSEIRMRIPAPHALIGREAAIAELSALLRGNAELITVTGGPGVGKTALAAFVTRSHEPVWMFDWADVTGVEEAQANIARTLGLTLASGFEAALETALEAQRPNVFVIDNAEHARRPAALLAALLASSAPNTKILVTSRRALALPNEDLIELSALSCEISRGARMSDAARMLAQVAFGAYAHLNEEELALLEKIARSAEGIPIAIETIAARVRSASLATVARDFANADAVLASTHGSALARHVSVEAALSWSWDMLSDDEKNDLFGASVFAGEFDSNAARAILGDAELAPTRLHDLRAHHMLETTGEGDDVHFRVPALIRSFVRARSADWTDAEETRERHARYFMGIATGTSVDWVLGLDSVSEPQRFPDVLLAVDWALARLESSATPDSFDVDLLFSALVGLAAMGAEGSSAALVMRRLERAASFAPSASRAAEAKLWLIGGALRRLEGDLAGAIASFELSAAEAPSPELRATALLAEAAALARVGKVQEARQLLPLADTEHDPRLRAEALRVAAGISAIEGDLQDAEHLARFALRAQVAAEVTPRPTFEIMLCVLISENGRPSLARTELQATRERLAAAGHGRLVAICDTNLGSAAFEEGDIEGAIVHYERAHEAHARIGDSLEAGLAIGYCGVAYLASGRVEDAQPRLERAILLLTRAGAEDRLRPFRGFLAATLAHDKAALAVERARGLLEGMGDDQNDRLVKKAALFLLAAREDQAAAHAEADAALEEARQAPPATFIGRLAIRVLEASVSFAAQHALPPLRVAADASSFEIDGNVFDLSRRPTLQRILRALAESRFDVPLTSAELIAAGWPGERIVRQAALSRLRVALCTLRKMGLRHHLVSTRQGHILHGRVRGERPSLPAVEADLQAVAS